MIGATTLHSRGSSRGGFSLTASDGSVRTLVPHDAQGQQALEDHLESHYKRQHRRLARTSPYRTMMKDPLGAASRAGGDTYALRHAPNEEPSMEEDRRRSEVMDFAEALLTAANEHPPADLQTAYILERESLNGNEIALVREHLSICDRCSRSTKRLLDNLDYYRAIWK
jgi:hypothetical protein